MFKNKKLFILGLALFLFPIFAFAANYLDGTLLRAKGDIKVYLINNNTKRWVSSLEVFNSNNFRWQKVKVVSKKEVAAIKEGEPIVLDSPSPLPEATESVATPIPTISVIPTGEKTLAPVGNIEIAPTSVKINSDLPAPDYIRADWLISHATPNYGRVGQRIVFKYSDKEQYRIENFNLYEKKPGNKYFHKIATFEEILSTGCEDIDIDGEWMLTEAGQCGYWSIQRVIPPGAVPSVAFGEGRGRRETAYLPASNYSVGEYAYYVAGADKDGAETASSSEAKLVFLDTVGILNPVGSQLVTEVYPVFKWTVASGWPAFAKATAGEPIMADYFIMISDNKNNQSPVWTKQLKIISGEETEKRFTYDGVSLNPASKYEVNIYGHYRKSEYEPDYISISLNIPEFWVKKIGWTSLFKNFFASIFHFAF